MKRIERACHKASHWKEGQTGLGPNQVLDKAWAANPGVDQLGIKRTTIHQSLLIEKQGPGELDMAMIWFDSRVDILVL